MEASIKSAQNGYPVPSSLSYVSAEEGDATMARQRQSNVSGPASSRTSSSGKRISQSDVPAHSLEEALRVPRSIYENYGGDPTRPLDVAQALKLKPGSSQFKMLCGAAIAYGLTEGGYNAAEITMTELSKTILSPLEEDADLNGKRQALMRPRVVGDFLRKYDGSPLPKEDIAHNVLESMGVPKDRTAKVLALIIDGANVLGMLSEIKGTKYVNTSPRSKAPRTSEADVPTQDATEGHKSPEEGSDALGFDEKRRGASSRDVAATDMSRRRVFITHGKNKSFIEPIKSLLHFGELEPVVAVEKQSVSKPVPEKVMSDMRSCGAAIIHVEDEMHLRDSNDKEHVVLNPNVLIEIGAAMGLYGRRFILLVKQGVQLPSNLQGLYEVRYQGDSLDGVATIHLLEAINAMKREKQT